MHKPFIYKQTHQKSIPRDALFFGNATIENKLNDNMRWEEYFSKLVKSNSCAMLSALNENMFLNRFTKLYKLISLNINL